MTHVQTLLKHHWRAPGDLAEAVGRPYTTVKGWWDTGRVPYREWPAVASAAGIAPRALFEAHEADRLNAASSVNHTSGAEIKGAENDPC